MCGENERNGWAVMWWAGSSPRVRGKRVGAGGVLARRGLIPACAGKTAARSPRSSRPRAHPRMCGENLPELRKLTKERGSSPRVRGKRHPPWPSASASGLIPACAGKTRPWWRSRRCPPAHPRVCGENAAAERRPAPTGGSSPRVRGKHAGGEPAPGVVRLIPACAGKTHQPRRAWRVVQAHPRVCGENIISMQAFRQRAGSSPRVRGKLSRTDSARSSSRLIPACAGKTTVSASPRASSSAHPRVCGENALRYLDRAAGTGSSPRVRGKPNEYVSGIMNNRLIPACAGKTESSVSPQ